ncbi:nitrite reductase (NAD(P)H), partial [Escherichia coli]
MQDVEAILQQSGPKVVLGGGVLGVEAAAALRLHGDDVTLIHRAGRLMEQQLDQQASDLLQAQLTGRGIRCELSSGLVSIEADCVTLLDGQRIAADGVVIATGVKPNISLAQECGAVCQQGIVVDEQLRTSMPGISAVGECCEINGQTWGLVAPCLKQAEVLAARLAGFI